MKQKTVRDLYEACKKQIEAGNGDKHLVVSGDNEGNSYHGMFYLLTPITEEDKDDYRELICDNNERNLENIIIVG